MKIKHCLLATVAAAGTLASTAALALNAYGLTLDQRIVRVNTLTPETTATGPFLSGFTGNDTALIGIDYREQDRLLYGVGNQGGVYTIAPNSGAMALVNNLSFTPSGTLFGVDFNPAADRLRIVSDTGQNLRHNVNTGGVTLNDGTLNDGAATPATVNGIVSAAYTNNDLSTNTGTVLFDINATTGAVVVQSPPNNGAIIGNGMLGLGPISGPVGFDIFTTKLSGVATQNTGVLVATFSGLSYLYSVNLLPGQARQSGGAFPFLMQDIAVIPQN